MGNALDLYCENCEMVTEHRVTRTHPEQYHWGGEQEEYLTCLLGRDLDFSLRQRIGRHCEEAVETIEMSFQKMQSLIDELDRLRLLLQGKNPLA